MSRTLAVIEMGTSAIRMEVAQESSTGLTTLDKLQHSLALGRDTFTRGSIASDTIEQCVQILRRFMQVLKEYGVAPQPDQLRAIATSAVREALNRDVFLDRILIATGVPVQIIDEAEVSRLTYHAVRPVLAREAFFRKADILVLEVGGGSTEALVFRHGKVNSSHVYRMGALRLSHAIADYQEYRTHYRALVHSQIATTIEQIRESIGRPQELRMVALGSDARTAFIGPDSGGSRDTLAQVSTANFAAQASRIINQSPDAIVREYGIAYPDAETMGTALTIYAELAKALRVKHILIGEANLRAGVLTEMAATESWTREFQSQILNSAQTIGRKYHVDERHARNVMTYAARLFAVMQDEHRLDTRHAMILEVAALLHDCGMFIGISGHHKHAMYIILHSDIFGLGRQDLELAAQVARYHRRAVPSPTHELYMALPREQRIVVSKLAAILRVANAMDRDRAKSPIAFAFTLRDRELLITEKTSIDLTAARLHVRERANLFEQVYGRQVDLRTASGA